MLSFVSSVKSKTCRRQSPTPKSQAYRLTLTEEEMLFLKVSAFVSSMKYKKSKTCRRQSPTPKSQVVPQSECLCKLHEISKIENMSTTKSDTQIKSRPAYFNRGGNVVPQSECRTIASPLPLKVIVTSGIRAL